MFLCSFTISARQIWPANIVVFKDVLRADVTLVLAEHVEQVRSKSMLIKLTKAILMMITRGSERFQNLSGT